MLWRLTTVIDCGTRNWKQQLMLAFQIADVDVMPKNPSLPVYKQFVKSAYGWLVDADKIPKSLLDCLEDKGSALETLFNWAGTLINLKLEDSEYNGKKSQIVVLKDCTKTEPRNDIEWWVDVKVFRWSDEIKIEDINALGFDNKFVKESDEYKKLTSKPVTQADIDEMF